MALTVVDATEQEEEVRAFAASKLDMDENERRTEIRQIMHRLEELREAMQQQMAETARLKDRLTKLELPPAGLDRIEGRGDGLI
jgi:predicted RNase H-like nuclease (RuvC/YqgF family)